MDSGGDRTDLVALRRCIFEPRAVAVVGAGRREEGLGARRLRAIRDFGFGGRLYAVNRTGERSGGMPGFRSVTDIEDPELDYVLVATPFAQAVDVVESCREIGVPAVQVLASPPADAGVDGRTKLSGRDGVRTRVIGPNTVGVFSATGGMTFVSLDRQPGTIGLISQSGGLTLDIVKELNAGQAFVESAISIGDAVDLEASDFLEMFASDDAIRCIGCYLEGVRDGRRFVAALREATKRKPVVMLRGGRLETGARAVRSHTGALTTGADVWAEAIRLGGAVEVGSLDELLWGLIALRSGQERARGPRAALIGNGGGMGVLTADELQAQGLELASLSKTTTERMAQVEGAAGATLGNPTDVPAGVLARDSSAMAEAGEILLSAPEVDFGVVHFNLVTFRGYENRQELLKEAVGMVERFGRLGKAIFLSLRGPCDYPTIEVASAFREVTLNGDIPTFQSTQAAVAAASIAWESYQARRRDPQKHNGKAVGHAENIYDSLEKNLSSRVRVLSQEDSLQLAKRLGMRVLDYRMAASAGEAGQLAGELGFPVAVKVDGVNLAHRTDIGGVTLGGRSAAEAEAMFERVMRSAGAHGYEAKRCVIQKMAEGELVELFVGARRDAIFGPIVIVGAGGVYAELIKDVAVGLAPVTHASAIEMISRLRCANQLGEYRGIPEVDVDALARVIERTSWVIAEQQNVDEIDLNPVVCVRGTKGVTLVDVGVYLLAT